MNRRGFLLSASAAAMLARPAWAAPEDEIAGGRGGRIIRVTTLKADGPGSLLEAVKAKGKRTIVFEVGGVIDLGLETVKIVAGDVTIAGQTAPSLVTLVRGGIAIQANNVVVQHIAVRPGEAGQAKGSGWECDGIYAYGAHGVEVSNCSITWATDEGLSASGKRFGNEGSAADVEAWRAFTSGNVRFLRNIVAEGLSNSTHSKGEHSKGTLIHDNVRNVVIEGSLYAHNRERNVLFKGGAQGEMRGNVVYNAGKRFAHYNLHKGEWGGHAFQTGDVAVANTVFLAGPSTNAKIAAFMLGGDGPLKLSLSNNLALARDGSAMEMMGRFGDGAPELSLSAPRTTDSEAQLRARMAEVLATCGARPDMRDAIDARIVADVKAGTGRIIDSENEVGGYPVRAETRSAFVEAAWDLERMARR